MTKGGTRFHTFNFYDTKTIPKNCIDIEIFADENRSFSFDIERFIKQINKYKFDKESEIHIEAFGPQERLFFNHGTIGNPKTQTPLHLKGLNSLKIGFDISIVETKKLAGKRLGICNSVYPKQEGSKWPFEVHYEEFSDGLYETNMGEGSEGLPQLIINNKAEGQIPKTKIAPQNDPIIGGLISTGFIREVLIHYFVSEFSQDEEIAGGSVAQKWKKLAEHWIKNSKLSFSDKWKCPEMDYIDDTLAKNKRMEWVGNAVQSVCRMAKVIEKIKRRKLDEPGRS